MKRFSLTTAFLFVALALVRPVNAAPLDHLVCHAVEDSSEAYATVALETLPFGVESGCVVRSKARALCVPASAAVLADAPDGDAQGDELTTERTCYRIECPERELPAVRVTDRFGTRPLKVLGARTICIPATPPEQP